MIKTNLTEDKVRDIFFKYLFPSISATLVTSIYILADTLMIGRGVGPLGIAALNLLLPLFSVFFGTGILFGVGGGVLMSVSIGKKDYQSAKEYFTVAFIGAFIVSILYAVGINIFFDPITSFLGKNEAMNDMVSSYGRILVTGAPAFVFSSFLQAFVRNDKHPKLSMIAVVSGGVTNVVLDYIFIFPLGMGMAGGAWATIIGSLLTVSILCTHFFTPDNTLKLVPNIQLQKLKSVIANGLSSFIMDLASGIVIFLFNKQLLTYVGDLGVVVYGIISNSSLIVASVCNGIAQATQPILATNFGAKKLERVKETGRLGAITMGIAGSIFVLLGVLFPTAITTAFVAPTTEILAMAVPAVRIYFLSFLGMGFNILLGTYFQSIMKPAYALVICLSRGLILNGIFIFTLPLLFGVNGIWITMILAEFTTLLIGLVLLFRKRLQK